MLLRIMDCRSKIIAYCGIYVATIKRSSVCLKKFFVLKRVMCNLGC